MKNKILMLGILALALITIVYAADTITISTPNDNGFIDGTGLWIFNMDTNSANVTNVSIWIGVEGSFDTAIDEPTAIVNNVSEQQTSWNYTESYAAIPDCGPVLAVNATAYNVTGGIITSDYIENVSLNKGSPTATYAGNSLIPVNEYGYFTSDQYFTLGLAPDTSIGFCNCTVSLNSLTKSISVSPYGGLTNFGSQDGCSANYLGSDWNLSENTLYSYTIKATDCNNNQTTSGTRKLVMMSASGTGYIPVDQLNIAPNNQQSTSLSFGDRIKLWFQSFIDKLRNMFRR